MVFKLSKLRLTVLWEFENDVKMYGIQTTQISIDMNTVFENDVKMYGIQTKKDIIL